MTEHPPAEEAIFSRPLLLRNVPEEGLRETVAATPEECAALAAQIGIPAIGALEGRFRIQRAGASGLHVTGRIRARVTQTCVVSLEDFETTLEEVVDIAFAPPAAIKARPAREEPVHAEVFHDLLEPDEPDPLIDGRIDLGRIAMEFLALALDPYPKKPGVAFDDPAGESSAAEEPARTSPFAALARLKDGGASGGGRKR